MLISLKKKTEINVHWKSQVNYKLESDFWMPPIKFGPLFKLISLQIGDVHV